MSKQPVQLLLLSICAILSVSGGYASTIQEPARRHASFFYGGPTLLVPSTNDNWLGGTGNWSSAADWSAGLPGSNSDVSINTGSDNVTLDTSSSINSLVLGGATGSSKLTGDGNAHTLTIAGALTVNQSGNLYLLADTVTAGANSTNSGVLDLESASSLQVMGDLNNAGTLYGGKGDDSMDNSLIVAGTLTNSGTISIGFLRGRASLTMGGLINTGSIDLGGANVVKINGDVNNSGQIYDDNNYQLPQGFQLLVSGNMVNSGTFATNPNHFTDSMTVGGTFTNTSTGLLSLNAASATFGALVNQGQISVQGAPAEGAASFSVTGAATNSGTILLNGLASITVAGVFTNNPGGELSLLTSQASMGSLVNEASISLDGAGVSLRVNGDVTNSGQIITTHGSGGYSATINVAGTLTNNSTGTLSLDGVSSFDNVGHIANAGTVSISNGVTLNVTGGVHAAVNALPGFLNSGIVNISQGGTLASPLSYVQTSGQTTVDGTLNIGGRGIINFAGGSVYGNQGAIQGTIISNAAINMGDGPMTIGQLSFMGSFTQGANGSLTFDIGGAAPGQYDQLNVSGKTQLNGLMTVDLINGFVPQVGNMFDIMNFSSSSGTFSKVLGLPINNQEHFVLEYNSTNLTLDVVPGQLSGANPGSGVWFASNTADSNGVSITTAFGIASHDDVPTSTPEPGTFLLLGSGLLCLGYVIRRRTK